MKLGKLNLLVPISMILCAAPGGAQKKDKAAEPSPLQTVSVKLPSLAVLPETLQVQDKGGVKITVGPVQYTLKEETLTTNRVAQPGFKENLLAPAPRHNYVFVERTYTPRIVVLPPSCAFRFTSAISCRGCSTETGLRFCSMLRARIRRSTHTGTPAWSS